MTGAEHIIAWAESDRTLYNALRDLERRRKPGAPDCYLSGTGEYYAAFNIVITSYRRAISCGDMLREDITANDIADAVKLALTWEMEG